MLSIQSVRAIARTYRKLTTDQFYIGDLDAAKLRTVVRATARSLATVSREGLAPEVYLPKAKVVSMLWAIYKAAKEQAKVDLISGEQTMTHLKAQRVRWADEPETVAWIDERLAMWSEAEAILKQVA